MCVCYTICIPFLLLLYFSLQGLIQSACTYHFNKKKYQIGWGIIWYFYFTFYVYRYFICAYWVSFLKNKTYIYCYLLIHTFVIQQGYTHSQDYILYILWRVRCNCKNDAKKKLSTFFKLIGCLFAVRVWLE